MTELDVRTDDHAVTVALRAAVAELLDGYAEAARLLAEDAPADLRDRVLAPLRRAADTAAAALVP